MTESFLSNPLYAFNCKLCSKSVLIDNRFLHLSWCTGLKKDERMNLQSKFNRHIEAIAFDLCTESILVDKKQVNNEENQQAVASVEPPKFKGHKFAAKKRKIKIK